MKSLNKLTMSEITKTFNNQFEILHKFNLRRTIKQGQKLSLRTQVKGS